MWLRAKESETNAPNDLLVLALICLSYVAAERIGAWGFLAVFAAGIGLRRAEVQVVRENPSPEHTSVASAMDSGTSHPPAEHLVSARGDESDAQTPAKAVGVLVADTLFVGETLERLIEFILIVCVGAALASHWDLRGLAIAVLLIFVIRPLGTALVPKTSC